LKNYTIRPNDEESILVQYKNPGELRYKFAVVIYNSKSVNKYSLDGPGFRSIEGVVAWARIAPYKGEQNKKEGC
jgi:hypothetical protein